MYSARFETNFGPSGPSNRNGGRPRNDKPTPLRDIRPVNNRHRVRDDDGGDVAYYKDPKEWDGRSWPPPSYVLCDVVAEVKKVHINTAIEGSMRVHMILTFLPPKGFGNKILEADYYPYSRVHKPGTAGKILDEGTKVGVQSCPFK